MWESNPRLTTLPTKHPLLNGLIELALAPYCVMAYSAPLTGFHITIGIMQAPLILKREGRDRRKSAPKPFTARLPTLFTQHERLQRANTFRDRQRANLAVILLDSDKPPVWTRTWSQLNACYSTKHISFSTRRVEDIDLSTVTLVIEILHHW